MNRVNIKTLICGDQDINCSCKLTDPEALQKINLGSLNFLLKDLQGYDMIVYRGSAGCKILKSIYTDTGIIKNK